MTQEEFKSNVRTGLNGWYSTSQTENSAVERIWQNREKFRALLEPVNREGMSALLDYLDECGFYYRPSSDTRHHNYPGGLAEHCLGVYEKMALCHIAKEKPDSVKIVGLLHDICKCDQYYFQGRRIRSTKVDGHGSRSVRLIKRFGVTLDEFEYRAIRYHMGFSNETDARNVGAAFNAYPLAAALYIADMEATFFVDDKDAKEN